MDRWRFFSPARGAIARGALGTDGAQVCPELDQPRWTRSTKDGTRTEDNGRPQYRSSSSPRSSPQPTVFSSRYHFKLPKRRPINGSNPLLPHFLILLMSGQCPHSALHVPLAPGPAAYAAGTTTEELTTFSAVMSPMGPSAVFGSPGCECL